uniref:RRM domain-containing protein n=1 Tax=Rhizophora mucronata TaxID=61149 RepID=A0A2P2PLN7_RHIMU
MSRKRDKSYLSRHDRAPLPKRRRPLPPPPPVATDEDGDKPASKPPPPPAVVVMGLSPDCSVLDLKSRFEIYGAISRIRIERDGVGSITFRSKDSAEAAIAASLDASFGITIDSKRVQVLWATDPLAQWGKGIGVVNTSKDNTSSSLSTSKLLRAGMPLSRHGRSNKLASAIVNPRSSSNGGGGGGNDSSSSVLDVPFKGREIIAYDDIL